MQEIITCRSIVDSTGLEDSAPCSIHEEVVPSSIQRDTWACWEWVVVVCIKKKRLHWYDLGPKTQSYNLIKNEYMKKRLRLQVYTWSNYLWCKSDSPAGIHRTTLAWVHGGHADSVPRRTLALHSRTIEWPVREIYFIPNLSHIS